MQLDPQSDVSTTGMFPFDTLIQEVDPSPETGEVEGLEWAQDGFLTELAGSIPGIDEAMSFAEVMKQVQSLDYSAIVFDTGETRGGGGGGGAAPCDAVRRSLGRRGSCVGTAHSSLGAPLTWCWRSVAALRVWYAHSAHAQLLTQVVRTGQRSAWSGHA
eukprot:359814-Chlamydomonas_euryale.AAC.3